MVKLLEANTGKHRSTINIEKAAKLTVKEDGTPRFAKYREQTPLDRAPTAETGEAAVGHTPDPSEAMAA